MRFRLLLVPVLQLKRAVLLRVVVVLWMILFLWDAVFFLLLVFVYLGFFWEVYFSVFFLRRRQMWFLLGNFPFSFVSPFKNGGPPQAGLLKY